MVKKRLSDLLREEGEKTEGADVEVPETQAPETQAPETQAPRAPAITSTEVPELETTILQLKQDIEAAQKLAQAAEAVFNQQIAALQAKITEQDSSIQQLKAEAETARQTILQLSQAQQPKAVAPARLGSTFLGGRSQPPTLPSPAVLPSPRAAEPELEPSQSQMIIPSRAAKPALSRPKLHELALHKVLDHPTQAGGLPPMSSEPKPVEKGIKLSEADVGWMD